MKRTKEDEEFSAEIDYQLRHGDFQSVPLLDTSQGTRYQRWYARLLTTLSLTTEGQKIVYAQTDHRLGDETVRFLLVTEKVVVVVDVENLTGDQPKTTTRVIGRGALTSLAVGASMPIDQDGAASYGWPGLVEIIAEYVGLDAPVVYTSMGHQAGNSAIRGPILELLAELQSDLSH
ncbi:hypothetical protein ACFY9N_04010 [Microbacterium sp. NPDC008134]|uniref:hypothetical protein n=1 Tax=Microbacterium sp. NPDC008134 TaxID=3364183 RepID=UPI0036E04D21